MEKPLITKNRRSLPSKIGRGFLFFFLGLIALILLIVILIQTAPVQNFGRKKIVSFLENKLQTKVAIGRLDIDFPKMLVLEGIYIEDKSKDTLLAGNQLKVDIDMYKLLKSEIQINEINLNGITVKVKRQFPDTAFNFQFLVDAFVTPTDPEKVDTAAPMKMAIEKIIVDKTRLVYKDVVTGNDVDIYLNHFDTRIQTFDLANLTYDVPKISINGLRGTIKQTKPLEITAVKTIPISNAAPQQTAFINFINQETTFKNIDFFYSNEVSGMATNIAFTDLTIHPEKFDLKNTVVAIKDIELNDLKGFFKMEKTSDTTQLVKLTTESRTEVNTETMPWKFTIGSLKMNNNNFDYDDNTMPKMRSGMDYAHLGLTDMDVHADNFLMHNDTIALDLTKSNLQEKSGFILDRMEADILYTNTGAKLTNIVIKTPGSEIKRSIEVRYPSLLAIQKEMGLLEMDINIDNSYIQVKDILTFVPLLSSQPAFSNPSATLYLNSKVSGSTNRLLIETLQFRGLRNTNVDISGAIINAMDVNNVAGDLSIKKFTTSRSDIISLTPKGTIPPNITIPESMSLTGKLKGGMKNVVADLLLTTSLGSAKIKGTISNAADKINAKYNADISINSLNVGTLTQQPQNVGRISATFSVVGKGYDPEKTNAAIKGKVLSAEVMKYVYRNLSLDANVAGQVFSAKANIMDPNIDLSIIANGNLGGSLPSFFVKADIDSIKTQALHLTPDPIFYHGSITADVPSFNMDALNGEVNVVNSVLVMNGQRITMDSVTLIANHANNEQSFLVKTDFVNAALKGRFKPEQLGDIFIEAIQPYYALIPVGKLKPADPYSFTLTANVVDHPTLHGFVPDLKRFDGLQLNSSFSSSEGINANIKMPYAILGTNAIDNVQINALSEGNALKVTATLDQLKSGASVALYKTDVRANLSDNKVNFGLATRDKSDKEKYKLAGLFEQQANNTFAVSLSPDSLLLNYDKWTINNDNLIRFGTTVVNARNFNLNRNGQHLGINSVNATANSPVIVDFKDFQIATLTSFAQADSLPITGMLNGNIEVKDLLKQPNFVADVNLNNLAFKRDTIGDVNVKVNNNTANTFAVNANITGRGNNISLTGNYFMKPADNSDFDFKLLIKQLPFKTLEGLSMGAITQSTGNLTGEIDITGKPASPKINGGISFNKTGFNLTALGSYFTIDDETIKINDDGILLSTFTIRDSANNALVINGIAGTQNFVNYDLDLTAKARNFQAINTTKKQNSLYYGKLVFNTNMKIKGTESSPIVDGTLKVTDSTNLTIVLPQAEPGLVDREGIIRFVDMDAPGNDSLFIKETLRYDSSFNKSTLIGYDLSANIEVSKEATFNVVIDEANGDFLQLKGEAILNGGIDPSGKITLTGTYEIESGGYELSFNFIRRKFIMQKGSKITWTGEPTLAQVDVTAVYVANTAPIDLVLNQISDPAQKGYYQQKLPFNVKLNMKGDLMKPELTFGIDLPKEGSNLRVNSEVLTTVNARLDQLKQEPSELNKQVFALLLLNRFVSENPFESSGGGGGFNAASYAKQSVSKILTEQLNKLATDLIAGVDVNFNVNSEEDYSTGQRRDRTDFNVQLSKRLLSDRLKVSVGSNYELEGPQQGKQSGANVIGNLTIDYSLTQDGRYLLRGYRKNDYDYVLEGQVVETGLKFIISADYNKISDLFRKKRKRKVKKDEDEDPATTSIPDNKKDQDNDTADYLLFTDKLIFTDNRKPAIIPVNDSTNVQ